MNKRKPAPTPGSVRWGARIDRAVYGLPEDPPWNYAAWDLFEQHAGKKISILAWGQPFGQLNLSPLERTAARGAISIVTMGLPVDEILSGGADSKITAMAIQAKTFGGEILLRPGWEMNGDWYSKAKLGSGGWGQHPQYAAAWRYLVDRMRIAGATNVKYVWCVNVLGGTSVADPLSFYPGDAYVDYVGIDGYNWGTNPVRPGSWKSPSQVFQPTVERVAQIAPTKQIVICETSSSEYGGDKAAWISQLLGTYVPSHPRIIGLVWFNDKDHADGMDWPIETSTTATAAFKAGIASSVYRPGS